MMYLTQCPLCGFWQRVWINRTDDRERRSIFCVQCEATGSLDVKEPPVTTFTDPTSGEKLRVNMVPFIDGDESDTAAMMKVVQHGGTRSGEIYR